ncbi:MAG: aldolase/citrate lyase family protein [Ardenticatenaceae bacterium]|nr:aldolase/citrate lyase family protein [Ardenticatenaceae bacterium]HBY93926.1 2-dehydro-3-deoxyglucarate aldolase [Chloroflexota bacterium]
MRSNKLKQALKEGGTVICVGPGVPSPELVEFLGHLGFDCIFIDAEHGVIGVERAQEMVRAADAVGIGSLTRVPKNDPAVILGYLETGTGGILVPHVNTADEVRQIMQAVKYSPLGIRGAHSGTRAANYGVTQSGAEYFDQANRETMVAAMIEEVAALENLNEILQVPGLDLCLIGPGDLAMSMGYPGQPDHPEVQAQVDLAVHKICAAGVAAGTVAADGEGVRRLFERGFQLALVSALRLLVVGARQLLAQARTEKSVTPGSP